MFKDTNTYGFEKPTKSKQLSLNKNKEGVVRNINGKVYVDFMYFNQRVRETSGLVWNNENAKQVRAQLDRIMFAIQDATFEFKKVFPLSKKMAYFSDLESKILGRNKQPSEVVIDDFASEWYELLKATQRVSERTLLHYRSLLDLYILPYFGELTFAALNSSKFDTFTVWAKKQQYREKVIGNKSINKCLVPLKSICKQAAITYDWGISYNPFFGYKKLPERDTTYEINPFSLEEQRLLIAALSDHWKPYFQFAFCAGLRSGEQVSLRVSDLDLKKKQLSIQRATTLNEAGKVVEGSTKNKYSRRIIHLLPMMIDILEQQIVISKNLQSEYLFCSPEGCKVHRDNLRGRVWDPALNKAGVSYRQMRQTRHSFATTALSLGENPLWIAKVMGHSTTRMVIEVYAKYTENLNGFTDGNKLNQIYQMNK